MKNFTIIFIILMLAVFSGFKIYRNSEKIVLKTLRGDILQIDFNNNKIIDDNETICVAGLETFGANLQYQQETLQKRLNLKPDSAIAIGFMTDRYVEDYITNKKVRVKFTSQKSPECRYAEIYTEKENYAERLYKNGFGIYNGKVSDKFYNNIEEANKLKLVILNHHSKKYHKSNCKYGLIAHDAIVMQQKDLPEDAKPCKFCYPQNKSVRKTKNKPASYIPPAPSKMTNGSIEFLLTDLTTKLKPDKSCSSQVCRIILREINSAQKTIDAAIYGWDAIPALETAFENAIKRGVVLRMVYDETTRGSSYYPDTKKLAALSSASNNDKNIDSASTNFIMHNKFLVIDGKEVITGSMNYSQTGLSGFNSNNLIVIKSKEIAGLYTEEFNQMLAGKFHTAKVKSSLPRSYILGRSKVSVYFSPQDRVITSRIIQLVNNSKKYVYVPAFLITHEGLSQALINAKKRGVDVRLIIDATNSSSRRSSVSLLRNVGIPVKVENYAGKMHSKSIIIDDKYIITGSMNFSNSGEKKNDENTLIIEDNRLAGFYRDFFLYLWKKIPDKYLKQNVRAEGKDSIGSCSDGIDNNFDGLIDSHDAACR